MSTPPPPPPETPSEQPHAGDASGQPAAGAPRRRRDPRRDLAGVGFVLLGGWFAQGAWNLDSSLLLRVVLVVLGAAVLGYGAVQLVQNRRR